MQPLAVTGQLAKLAAFGPPAAGAKSWLRLDLHTCPRCEQLNVLDAKRVDVKVEKGTESETVRGIVEGLLLSPAGASEVTALGRARPAA